MKVMLNVKPSTLNIWIQGNLNNVIFTCSILLYSRILKAVFELLGHSDNVCACNSSLLKKRNMMPRNQV